MSLRCSVSTGYIMKVANKLEQHFKFHVEKAWEFIYSAPREGAAPARRERKRCQSGSRDRLCGYTRARWRISARSRARGKTSRRQHGVCRNSATVLTGAAVDVSQRAARRSPRVSACRRVPRSRSAPHRRNPLNGRTAARIVLQTSIASSPGRSRKEHVFPLTSLPRRNAAHSSALANRANALK